MSVFQVGLAPDYSFEIVCINGLYCIQVRVMMGRHRGDLDRLDKSSPVPFEAASEAGG